MTVADDIDWIQQGREVGLKLDAFHAVVVVGDDVTATTEVALGIARVQAQHRKVAVGDLFGEAPVLQSLVESEDPHGLVDSFLYGVSLNKIAYPVADSGDLFVMPSGTGPIDYDELFALPRWRRLAAGFGEVGALLVLAAPAGAARVHELVDNTQGAIVVGDIVPPELPVARAIAWVRPKRGQTALPAGAVEPAPHPVPAELPTRRRRRIAGYATGLLLALALAAGGVWFWQRPFAAKSRPRVGVKAGTPAAVAVTKGAFATDSAVAARADSIRRDSVAAIAAAAGASDSFPLLPAANGGDSSAASAFAVRLEQTNTTAGALLDLRGKFDRVPASTYGLDARTRFFVLVAGAYPTRPGADSLLAELRARKLLPPASGSVTSLPYAFLVQTDVPANEVPARIARYRAQGQPVYALRQPNGAAHLYYGAYESPQQAALAVPSVKKAGMTPTLVYRIGRVF